MPQSEMKQLEFLASPKGREILEMDLPAEPLAAQKKLRKHCDAEFAPAVTLIKQIRKKALSAEKFPAQLAAEMLCGDVMYQQASSMRLGTYVANKLKSAGGSVVELCCGMGADAIAFAKAGLEVKAYDISPQAVFCGKYNAELMGVGKKCEFICQDVTLIDIASESIIHIDPDRRATGRRGVSLEDSSPGQEFLESLMKNTRGGAMKLSPALSWRDLEHWENVTLEYISEGGVCRQLVAWWGDCACEHRRVATVVWGEHFAPQSQSLNVQEYQYADIRSGGAFLVEPGPAVLASGGSDALAGEYKLWKRCPQLDWLFADKPLINPLCRNFEIIQQVSGRVKDIKQALKKLNAGTVEIKPRGVKLDTDQMQKKLSGKGSERLVVLWTRFGEKQTAFIAKRCD